MGIAVVLFYQLIYVVIVFGFIFIFEFVKPFHLGLELYCLWFFAEQVHLFQLLLFCN